MNGLFYLFALTGLLLTAKGLAGWSYEKECRRAYEEKKRHRCSQERFNG